MSGERCVLCNCSAVRPPPCALGEHALEAPVLVENLVVGRAPVRRRWRWRLHRPLRTRCRLRPCRHYGAMLPVERNQSTPMRARSTALSAQAPTRSGQRTLTAGQVQLYAWLADTRAGLFRRHGPPSAAGRNGSRRSSLGIVHRNQTTASMHRIRHSMAPGGGAAAPPLETSLGRQYPAPPSRT